MLLAMLALPTISPLFKFDKAYTWCIDLGQPKSSWGPFLESPGNFSGP